MEKCIVHSCEVLLLPASDSLIYLLASLIFQFTCQMHQSNANWRTFREGEREIALLRWRS